MKSVLCACLLCGWAGLSAQQARVWMSNEALWGHARAIGMPTARVLLNSGRALDVRGTDPAGAERLYREAWAAARTLRPAEFAVIDRAVRTNLGHLAMVNGHPDQAVALLEATVRDYHDFPPAQMNYSLALAATGHCQQANAIWSAVADGVLACH